MNSNASKISRELKKHSSPYRKKTNEWFFKTKKGQYGYGDKFIGVSVPDNRKVAKLYRDADFETIKDLLDSPIHEHRTCACLILTDQFQTAQRSADWKKCDKIFHFYLKDLSRINNWDLVDGTAPIIVGETLIQFPHQQKLLKKLSRAKIQWSRRIVILATFAFIKRKQLDLTYFYAEKFMSDPEDLMHKSTGWMLREAGKKDPERLKNFIGIWAPHPKSPMPRTMLRYAIEKFPESERKAFLSLKPKK